MKVGFYLLGKKGFTVLSSFLDGFGQKSIGFIVVGRDSNVDNDFFDEIVELCKIHNINFHERSGSPEGIENKVDCSFAIGWRWIIKQSSNLIVLHDSLLPKYRGFSPLVNMLINKEKKIGVTALFASEEFDKGDIIEQASLDVTYPIKINEAINKISLLYVELVLKISNCILSGIEINSTKQIEKEASYSMWRDEFDYAVDWSKDSEFIQRFVNSVSEPFAGGYSYINNNKVRIIDVEIIPDVYIENRIEHIGKCIFKQESNPIIICGTGLLLLKNVEWDVDKSKALDSLTFRTRLTSTPRDI